MSISAPGSLAGKETGGYLDRTRQPGDLWPLRISDRLAAAEAPNTTTGGQRSTGAHWTSSIARNITATPLAPLVVPGA